MVVREEATQPNRGCRQEGCSSSAINLTCAMAQRARAHPLRAEESQAGIISFVRRLSTGSHSRGAEEPAAEAAAEAEAEAAASAAVATTRRSNATEEPLPRLHASAQRIEHLLVKPVHPWLGTDGRSPLRMACAVEKI